MLMSSRPSLLAGERPGKHFAQTVLHPGGVAARIREACLGREESLSALIQPELMAAWYEYGARPYGHPAKMPMGASWHGGALHVCSC